MEFYLKKTFIFNVIAFPYKNKLAEESCPYLWNGKNDKNVDWEVSPVATSISEICPWH